VGIQVELKRKFDEAMWIERFMSYNEEVLDAESNIKLKDMYGSYVGMMNAQEYFKKIDHKIALMWRSS
jgi:hypothetical protein